MLLSPNSRFVVASLPYEKDGYTVVDLVEQHGAPWRVLCSCSPYAPTDRRSSHALARFVLRGCVMQCHLPCSSGGRCTDPRLFASDAYVRVARPHLYGFASCSRPR